MNGSDSFSFIFWASLKVRGEARSFFDQLDDKRKTTTTIMKNNQRPIKEEKTLENKNENIFIFIYEEKWSKKK